MNDKFFFGKILFCAAALICHLFQVTSSIDGLGHLQLPPEQPLQVFLCFSILQVARRLQKLLTELSREVPRKVDSTFYNTVRLGWQILWSAIFTRSQLVNLKAVTF